MAGLLARNSPVFLRATAAVALLVLAVTLVCPHHVLAHGGGHDDDDAGSGGSQVDPPADPDPSVPLPGTAVLAHGNIGLGFGITALAAICSALGSLLPFYDDLPPRWRIFGGPEFLISTSGGFLAASLSFASGLLSYLALSDLLPEAAEGFGKAPGVGKKNGPMLAAACFVGVMVLMLLAPVIGRAIKRRFSKNAPATEPAIAATADDANVSTKSQVEAGAEEALLGDDDNDSKTPQTKAAEMSVAVGHHTYHVPLPPQLATSNSVDSLVYRDHQRRLRNLGIQIAGALAVHNFPEGLATFATIIASPRVGVLFGVALALHKIPEGILISLPLYYATGSRWRAFLFAAGIGAGVQMLGAVLGYLLFVTYWNTAVSGALLAMAAGVLFYTVIHSMIPLARQYDPNDRFCTIFTVVGVSFFTIVNALFSYT